MAMKACRPLSRSFKPLVIAVVALATLCAATPTASAAGTRPVSCHGVTVSSGVLTLSGVLASAEDLEGALRVKATRKGRKPYFLPRGDLVSEASVVHRIGPGHVKITNPEAPLPFDAKKKKGRWRSIPVAVEDVHFAGEYKGRLELGSGGCKVDLTVVVAGAAEISLVGTGEKAVKLKLARCRDFSCGPDDFVAGLNASSSRRDQVEVQVDNTSQAPAEVTGVQVALNSDSGEEIVPEAAFVPPATPFTLSPQRAEALPAIGIKRGEIAPGHYTGAIYLTVAAAEKRISLPFELDLKDGPFLALLALVAALLVQLAVALSKFVQPRKPVLGEVAALSKKARATLGPDGRLFEKRLEKAKGLARDGKLALAKAACVGIDADIQCLRSAQALEAKAREQGGGKLSDEVVQMLDEMRAAAESGDGDMKTMQDGLKGAVEKTVPPEPSGVALETAAAGMAGMMMFEGAEVGSSPGRVDRGAQKLRNVARRISRLIKTEATKLGHAITWLSIYVLPWVLRGLLVAVFLFAGLKELYFGNATFGAQPVVDYGGLLLWGLTAAGFNTVLGKIVPGAGGD
jgi:type 1 fimbria pilin